MMIDNLIQKWEDEHYILLKKYSKGNVNNDVMIDV